MNKNDISKLENFKKLIKIEIIFWILFFIFIIIMSSVLLIPMDNNSVMILVTIGVSIVSILMFIVTIIIKIKEFSIYNSFSEEFKEKNSNSFVFLILSIFFGLIFVIIIYFTLPKMKDGSYEESDFIQSNNSIEKILHNNEIKTKDNEFENQSKKLKSLKELLDQEIITKEEFKERKDKILKEMK